MPPGLDRPRRLDRRQSPRSAGAESSVEEARDRLAGLLPDDALQDALEGTETGGDHRPRRVDEPARRPGPRECAGRRADRPPGLSAWAGASRPVREPVPRRLARGSSPPAWTGSVPTSSAHARTSSPTSGPRRLAQELTSLAPAPTRVLTHLVGRAVRLWLRRHARAGGAPPRRHRLGRRPRFQPRRRPHPPGSTP